MRCFTGAIDARDYYPGYSRANLEGSIIAKALTEPPTRS